MVEGFRRALAAGALTAALTAEKARELVRHWVGAGLLTTEQGSELTDALRLRDDAAPSEPPVPLAQPAQPMDPVDTSKSLVRQMTARQRDELMSFLVELGGDEPRP